MFSYKYVHLNNTQYIVNQEGLPVKFRYVRLKCVKLKINCQVTYVHTLNSTPDRGKSTKSRYIGPYEFYQIKQSNRESNLVLFNNNYLQRMIHVYIGRAREWVENAYVCHPFYWFHTYLSLRSCTREYNYSKQK